MSAAIVVVISLTLITASASADPTYSVSGTVSTQSSGQPIANVTVTALDSVTEAVVASATTDAAGHYATSVPAGTYTFHAVPSIPNTFLEATTEPRVVGSDSTVDISLVRASISHIHGTITDRYGNPVANLSIGLGNAVSSDGTQTNSQGEYLLEVPDGSYGLNISNTSHTDGLPGYFQLNTPNFVVDGDATKNFVITSYELRVHVSDSNGNPVVGAYANSSYASDASTSSGGFDFTGSTSDQAPTGSDGIAHLNTFALGNGSHSINVYPVDGSGLANTTFAIPPIHGDTDVYLSFVGGSPSAIILTPRAFDYGTVPVGSLSTSQSYSITNILGGEISVSAATLSGTNPADFTIVSNSCNGAVLGVLASCSVATKFSPISYGPKSARLRIFDTGPGSPHIVTLTGNASDVTPPTIAITAPGNGQSVHLGDIVPIAYACADESGGSGIDSCTGDLPVGGHIDTSHLGTFTFAVSARDTAGNASSNTVQYSVVPNDSQAPSIAIASPVDGSTIPRGQSRVAQFSCQDESGGSGLASCVGSQPNGSSLDTNALGSHQITVTAKDNAGNTATKTASYSVVDITSPTISVTAPLEGTAIPQRQLVNAQFTCQDESGGSGIASCIGTIANGSPLDTATVGARQLTITATDRAGNQRSQTVHYSVVDVTAPLISSVTPGSGAHYAQGTVVNANYACTDEAGGSGLASCVGTVQNGRPIDTATYGNHTFTINASDSAGNRSTKTINYVVDDRTAPQIQIISPAGRYNVFGYVLGLPRANFSCADNLGGSGMASCTAAVDGQGVAQGAIVPYLWLGSHVFTVTAIDNAGNRVTSSVTYVTSVL
jgi:uncharacterized UPF0146 family protein